MKFPGPVRADEVPRLRRQHEVIRDLLLHNPMSSYRKGGPWWTLSEIAQWTGYPEASISAQLRHLRRKRFGSYRVEKRRRDEGGTWEYRVRRPEPPTQITLY